MEYFDLFARWTHVGAGVVALILAPVAMATTKGGANHRRWGRIYFWAMAWVLISTLLLMLLRPSVFLLGVGVLSFYSAFTARRVLAMKRPTQQPPTAIDWGGAALTLAFGLITIGWGLAIISRMAPERMGGNTSPVFGWLGLVFGTMTCLLALNDMRRFRRPSNDPYAWWYHHMYNMLSSYVGALTAFAVQTVSRWMQHVDVLAPYAWLTWVLPGIVGTILIHFWIAAYRRKFRAMV